MTRNAMVSQLEPADILAWLAENPVPPGPSKFSDEWLTTVREWDPRARFALVSALRFGTEDLQYAAQVALREQGAEVWLEDDDDDVRYVVRMHDQPRFEVRPRTHQRAPIRTVQDLEARQQTETSGEDPYRLIEWAAKEIESRRTEMKELSRVRSRAIRELLERGATIQQIAQDLNLSKTYVYQLLKRTEASERKVPIDDTQEESGLLLLTVSNVAQKLGLSEGAVRAALNRAALIGWKSGNEWRVPADQFLGGRVLPEVQQLMVFLTESLDRPAADRWLLTPKEELGSDSPMDLVRRGELQSVMALIVQLKEDPRKRPRRTAKS